MSIYIDPPTWPAHGTVFSHLISDVSLAELHKFAASRGGISERIFLSHQARQLFLGGGEPARTNLRAELTEWERDPQKLLRTLGGILCIYRVHKRRPPRAG